MEPSEVVIWALRKAVDLFVWAVSFLLFLLQVANANYPQATLVVVLVVGAYVAYLVLKRVIRTWISILVATVKFVAVLAVVVVVVAVYSRGVGRFVNQDVPNLVSLWNSDWRRTFYGTVAGQAFNFSPKDEYEEYFQYANDHFREGDGIKWDAVHDFLEDHGGEAKRFVEDNWPGVQDFLRNF